MIRRLCRRLMEEWRVRFDRIAYARSIGVRIGNDCRLLGLRRETFGSEPYLIRIGNHVTVTAGVRFITHDGGVWVFRPEHPDIDVLAPIVVGNNVFIGINAILMPGVQIGDNSVVGAGSVVTRSVPPDTVVVGVPAKPLRTREEYWGSLSENVFHIRSLPARERRRILEEHFLPVLEPGTRPPAPSSTPAGHPS